MSNWDWRLHLSGTIRMLTSRTRGPRLVAPPVRPTGVVTNITSTSMQDLERGATPEETWRPFARHHITWQHMGIQAALLGFKSTQLKNAELPMSNWDWRLHLSGTIRMLTSRTRGPRLV